MPESLAAGLDALFDQHFKKDDWDVLTRTVYPDFNVRCLAYIDIPPRDPMFEFYLDISRGSLDRLFRGERLRIPSSGKVLLVFPERWLTVREERALMNTLVHCEDAKSKLISSVDLITRSAIILTDLPSRMLRMLKRDTTAETASKRGGGLGQSFFGAGQIS